MLLADATGQVEAEERMQSLNVSLVQQMQEVQEHSILLERANKDLEGLPAPSRMTCEPRCEG